VPSGGKARPAGTDAAQALADYHRKRDFQRTPEPRHGGEPGVEALAFGVLLKPDATHAVGQLNPEGYAKYGLIASLVMLVAILVSAAGTHRHIPTLRAPPEKRKKTLGQTLAEVRETLNNRSFLFLLASSIATALAGGLAASMNGYFNTFFWGFSAAQISVITLGVFVSAFVALPTAPLLSRRFGKKHTAMLLALLSLLIGIGPVLLRLAGLFPANDDPALFGILFTTSIVGVTCGIIASTMGSSMIADVVEEAELKTGRRSEGLFFAASAFVGKSVSGFGILAAALLIDATAPAFDGALDRAIMRLVTDTVLRSHLSEAAAAVCDGQGAGRAAEALLKAIAARGDKG
jgi:Na+/melibiose symporter-like transporter